MSIELYLLIMETSMDFDLNNQAEPAMVLKNDTSNFIPSFIKRFRGDIGRACAFHASDREFESHGERLTIFFPNPNFF